MTSYTSHLPDTGNRYQSTVWVESKTWPGVRFEIVKMSLSRRVQLTRLVRPLWDKHGFHSAGSSPIDQLASVEIGCDIDATYLRWGLISIENLLVDGAAVTAERLLDAGPEDLCREVVEEIKLSCGLTDAERKN